METIGKIDHIGMAVHSIDRALAFYEQGLGLECQGREEVASQKVRVAFFSVGETRIELLEPMSRDSPVARFLDKRGEGIHHIAYLCDDIQAQLDQARAAGIRLVNEKPVPGAGGKWVAFLHPTASHGVLTELCAEGAGE